MKVIQLNPPNGGKVIKYLFTPFHSLYVNFTLALISNMVWIFVGLTNGAQLNED